MELVDMTDIPDSVEKVTLPTGFAPQSRRTLNFGLRSRLKQDELGRGDSRASDRSFPAVFKSLFEGRAIAIRISAAFRN
jgi:hypothetical protein